MKVFEIPISDILIPKERVRATFTEEQYQELKASIEKHGFTIPILVKERGDGKYELIDGEHRIKVAKELGMTKIPACVIKADEKKAIFLNILANTARGSQNPMDVAEALKRAYDSGATIEELALATGHTEDWVKLYLALNDLPDEYKQALREGKLKVGHVKEALKLPNPIEVDYALATTIKLGWTVDILKNYVRQRIEDLRRAEERGDKEFLEKPPDIEYAQKIAMYQDCLFCGRKFQKKDLFMPVMCQECRTLLEYVIDQIGEPKKAMDVIYRAVSMYYDMLAQQEKKEEEKKEELEEKKEEKPKEEKKEKLKILEELGLSEEDIKLLVLLKKLKEVDLL